MARKRNRLEIIRDILKITNEKGRIPPTRLIHSTNLSPQMFKEYILELTAKGLILEKHEKNKRYFALTKKGVTYLEEYRAFSNLIENFGL